METQTANQKKIIFIVIIAMLLSCGIGVFVALRVGKVQGKKEMQVLYNGVADSLHQSRNALNQQVSITQVVYGKLNDFKNIHATDSTTIALQKLVNKNTASATVLNTATTNVSEGKPAVVKFDTVRIGGKEVVYAEYKFKDSSRWHKVTAFASKDSFRIADTTFNEFHLAQEWKRPKFYKRKVLEASITNLNPNTVTTKFKTFTIEENKSNRIQDAGIGFIIGAVLTEVFNSVKITIPIR